MVQYQLPVREGFVVMRFFAFQPCQQGFSKPAGRQSVSPAEPALDTNNKEVPLNARESDPEMQ